MQLKTLCLLAGLTGVLLPQTVAAGPGADDERARLENALAADPYNVELSYRIGVLAYQQGDLASALEMFERTVALNPGHAGALLDMAITCFDRGEYDDAEALFQRLEALPESARPARVSRVVRAYRARIRALRSPWQPQLVTTLAMGYNSNANQGLASSIVTLPADIALEVDPALQAQADPFAEVALDLRSERALAGGRLGLAVGLRARRWATQNDYRQGWLVAGADYLYPLAPQWQVQAALYGVEGRLGGMAVQRTVLSSVQLTRQPGPFSQWLRWEAAGRQFPESRPYDSSSQRYVAGLGWATQRWQVRSEAGYTRDTARHDRPGGNRQRYDLLLEADYRLLPAWTLAGSVQAEYERQQAPFNRTEFGNFYRTDRTRSSSLSLAWQPQDRQRWALSLNRYRLASTLDLYDLGRTEVRLEWQHAWF